jgi:hypothetical protein
MTRIFLLNHRALPSLSLPLSLSVIPPHVIVFFFLKNHHYVCCTECKLLEGVGQGVIVSFHPIALNLFHRILDVTVRELSVSLVPTCSWIENDEKRRIKSDLSCHSICFTILLQNIRYLTGKLHRYHRGWLDVQDSVLLTQNRAAMAEWLRCSTRIHKVLCSNLSITIHGMTLDKSLTAKLSRMTHS